MKVTQLAILGALAIATVGCGKKSTTTGLTQEGGNTGNMITPVAPNPNPSPSPTATTSPSSPAYTFSFEVTGPDAVWTSPVITGADSILKVTIKPQQGIRIDGSGYDLNYGCSKYDVEFAGETRTTPLIRTQGASVSMCSGQGTSAWTDFSSRLGGSSGVQIKIKKARTDFLCQNYYYWVPGNPETFACPVHAAHTTHRLSGTLCVQVNGTVACPTN